MDENGGNPYLQPEPAPGAGRDRPPASAGRKRRGCLACCLAAVAVPLAALLVLLVWINSGPAPAPADCLPEDYPVRIVVREPAGLVKAVLEDDRWRRFLAGMSAASGEKAELPAKEDLDKITFLVRQVIGSECAVAADAEGEFVAAAKCGFLGRAAGKLGRLFGGGDADGAIKLQEKGKKESNFCGFLGNTAVFSPRRGPVAEVLGRRKAILAKKGSGAASRDVRLEVEFRKVRPKAGEQAAEARQAAFVFDLPQPTEFSGRLRSDWALEKATGALDFAPGDAGAPPPLPASLASARLVPADALGYWVWSAPKGSGRWSPAGRLGAFLGMLNNEEAAEYEQLFTHLKAGEKIDAREVIGKRLSGERAISVVGQPGPGGKSLLAAVSLMVETDAPQAAWPLFEQIVLAHFGGRKADAAGKPPTEDGKLVYPHLVERRYKGHKYLEAAYAYYPLGSGFRPAFGVAGRFLVTTSSKAELHRMIDRAAGGGGKSLAGSKELVPRRGRGRPAAVMLLKPKGRGGEITDLALAVARIFGGPEEQPTEEDARHLAAFGRLLSMVGGLRADWLPRKDGSLRLEIEARLVPAGR